MYCGLCLLVRFQGNHNSQLSTLNSQLCLVEQSRLHSIAARHRSSEVPVGEGCHHTSALRALYEALHDEIRLVHLLDGARVLADGCGYGRHADRTAAELVDDGEQYLVVDLVQTILVDVERRER